MRISIILTGLVMTTGCSRTIEVPENKVGVLYSTNNKIEREDVLKNGQHTIDFFTDVVLYDVTEQEKNFSFDVLFKDASPAKIDFSMNFIPKADSLAKICQKYEQTTLDNSISVIVELEIRSQVRALMQEKDRNKLNEEMIFNAIEKHLRTEAPANGIIEIKSFSAGKVTF